MGDKITLDLSPEARGVLNDLMNRTDSNAADVFRKALALYKAALDAHEEDKAVGSATTPDVLETEFVGLGGISRAEKAIRGLDALDDIGDEDEQRETLDVLLKALDEDPL